MCDFCKEDKRFGITFKTIKGQKLSWCHDCEYEIMYQKFQEINNKIKKRKKK